jgi:hypothetical protein
MDPVYRQHLASLAAIKTRPRPKKSTCPNEGQVPFHQSRVWSYCGGAAVSFGITVIVTGAVK